MCKSIGLVFARPQFEHDTTCTSYVDFQIVAFILEKICHHSRPISEQSVKHHTQGRVAFLDP